MQRLATIGAIMLMSSYALAQGVSDPSRHATHAGVILPDQRSAPGGVVVVPIRTPDAQSPKVYYHDRKVAVFAQSDSATATVGSSGCKVATHCWLAVVGIPLYSLTAKASDTIHITYTNGATATHQITLSPAEYREQRFTLPMSTKYTKREQARIDREFKKISHAMMSWTEDNSTGVLWQIQSPVPPAQISSPYGNARIYTHDKRPRFHKGTDLALPQGTPIRNIGRGRVVLSESLFLTGNTVMIDHGYGLVSLYAHMHKRQVKQGQIIGSGEIIGTVGSTGRATGPHLHLGLILNGYSIDPALFVRELQHAVVDTR